MPAAGQRLVLGTAQLGLDYGVANLTGRPSSEVARDMVKAAWEGGITRFDTARAYGHSEAVLGQALRELGLQGQALVVSKLHPRLQYRDYSAMEGEVAASLRLLGVECLHGLLVHRASWLAHWDQGLGENLQKLVDKGMTRQVGVSVYSWKEAIAALELPLIRLVQMPFNLLDRSALEQGVFSRAGRMGKSIWIRSVYLQGLLVMDLQQIPSRLAFARSHLEKIRSVARGLGCSVREVALAYAWYRSNGSHLVVGAETVDQVRDNLRMVREIVSRSQEQARTLVQVVESGLSPAGEAITNPSLWPREGAVQAAAGIR